MRISVEFELFELLILNFKKVTAFYSKENGHCKETIFDVVSIWGVSLC